MSAFEMRGLGLLLRMMLAFVAGGLTVASLPPFSILIAVPVAFSTLLLVLDHLSVRRSFIVGWAFGVGQFCVGTFWITESFYVDSESFGALAIPAIATLSAGLAIFPGAATAMFAWLSLSCVSGTVARCLLLATTWTAAEWMRGHLLTGFPWNLSGYALVEFAALRQPAAVFGSYGLSFLVVLVGTLPAAALLGIQRVRFGALALGVAIVAIVAGTGTLRLIGYESIATDIDVRVVQGNIPQREKWGPGSREVALARYLDLSTRQGSVDVLLWPETAFPGYLGENASARARIAQVLPDSTLLLTGVLDRVESDEGRQYFNTVQAYDGLGSVKASYAKHHLVPFGEYAPLGDWLPFERLTESLADFTPGPGPRTLSLPGVPPVAVAICYEIIFPSHLLDDQIRPGWIFNATNDAWFGTSIGPKQHLASARMRAVEEGLPVVRAANTGISAIIDSNGSVVQHLATGQTGVIDAPLPAARPPTLYSRIGDWAVLALIAYSWILWRLSSALWSRLESGQTYCS